MERDCLQRLRAADTPISAAVRKELKNAFHGLGLVKNLDVDAAATTVTNDIALLEVAKEHRSRTGSNGGHGSGERHRVPVEVVFSVFACPYRSVEVGL